MTPFLFMCFLHFTSIWKFSSGEFLQESNTVYAYGLPELTRDILERIKAATGQPINTSHFFPIQKLIEFDPNDVTLSTHLELSRKKVAASSKDYEVIEHHPYLKTTKVLKLSKNSKLDGGHYLSNKKDKNFGSEKEYSYEVGNQEKEGSGSVDHKYGNRQGKEHKHYEDSFYKKNHNKSKKRAKGSEFKKGRKRGKFRVEKGFRDIYHKDEEKKSDYFWNNLHEEGKWIEYGYKNRKNKKSHDKGGEGKKEKTKTEDRSYEKKENKCIKCKVQ